MDTSRQGDSKRQILDHLKRTERLTAATLAEALGVTSTAVRQHLEALESNGLVTSTDADPTGGRGRPAMVWKLTSLAAELFPDRHSDLTVELISAIRAAVGEEGLNKVIGERTSRQREAYVAIVGGTAVSLPERVRRLGAQRAAEGYLAEVTTNDDGSFDLIEHHCPICEAAESCTYLCRDELALFQDVIGPDANVERTTHLLSGDSRCSYRVTPATRREPDPQAG